VRILLIADGRSPITKNWLRMLRRLDYEIYLLSTFPHGPIEGLVDQITIPVGFSRFAGGQVRNGIRTGIPNLSSVIAFMRPVLMYLRSILTPLTLQRQQVRFLEYVLKIQPDIVHALRIPFEGMLGSALFKGIPFVVSIWGNDLTLHAGTSFLMKQKTRKTLLHADGLMADTARDINLARETGIREGVPGIVVPGSGGLDLKAMKTKDKAAVRGKFGLPEDVPLIINPRGFRPGSVHQDVFFTCIPHVLAQYPEAYFVCPAMEGQPMAEKWVRQYEIDKNVALLPFISQEDLWALYKDAQVYVSLSSHDGTPNSFLEAIALGCFPVVGDIASLREWVEPGKNGLLVDPFDEHAAADAVISALVHKDNRDEAAKINQQLVKNRADIKKIRKSVGEFYLQVLNS
jgi:glycosyltransferase involved in cell wall biosynthesis